jgi:hypothetical protein
MKLPNGMRALVDIAKLRDYSLDPVHEEGKHKARVFKSALGISRGEAEWLKDQLMKFAQAEECEVGRRTDHGQRFVMNCLLTHSGKSARIRIVWNIRPNEDFPRMVTCYVI